MEIIIGITGASGVCYGLKLLEILKQYKEHTIHLVISENAKKLIDFETDYKLNDIIKNADNHYENTDLAAEIASGSKIVDAMVIAPCSMSTAAKINTGITDNLITRAADVCLKERRKLILVPRETPVSTTHLKNLFELSTKDVYILPAMPAFYHKPKTLDDQIEFVIGKILDNLAIPHKLFKRWSGKNP